MSSPVNHTKLGAFVLLGLAALLATVVAFGAQRAKRETVAYHTYFNESVQGLELGAPVRFRGVTIGYVKAIEIAPDHRHVDVISDLDVADVRRMGLAEHSEGRGANTRFKFLIPPDLRAQLGSQGITGIKYVSIDFFDPKSNPVAPLPFPVPEETIPAAPSMMKSLEDSVTKAMDKLPELVDAVVVIVNRVDGLIATLEKEGVTEKAASTIAHADQVLGTLDKTIKSIDRAQVPEKAGKTLDDMQHAIGKMNALLDKVGGEAGLVASAQKATESVGQVGRDAHGTTRQLDETLKEVRDAASSIRSLADALEKDPDMLVKGRAKGKGAQ
jgi:ABC-type transporter Mla subunit MlaD